ncbi:MAG: transposase [Oscillospiraceae bacterium]|nr:transposase [Oscillospiraceae bacterium]
MIRAHKIRLYPNNTQATYFAKACGVARFAYNWALARSRELYEQDSDHKFNEAALRRELNAKKKERYPWMLEVTKCAPQLAIKDDLSSAFRNFFEKRAGFPRFHKKGIRDSFSLSNDQFKIRGSQVQIPKLGCVRLAEQLRFEGKILSATVRRAADNWYISVQVEIAKPEPIHRQISENQAIGVDVGVTSLAVLSDGRVVTGSKPSRKYEDQLRRAQQSLSRKKGSRKGEKKSSNYRKQQIKVSRIHEKIANSRNEGLHKLTSMLTRNYSLIGIEDLNVKGMVKNHNLSKSIHDQSWGEFSRQLTYKADATGSHVHYSDRFYPSSQLCSKCGCQNAGTKDLSIREWVCPECGAIHDRDLNAAENLRKDAIKAVFGVA